MAGETIARDVAARLGFDARDADVLATLVRHHLLLIDTATRRDLDDPATVGAVAEAVGSAGTLELLHALTEADALATGPAAWSAWRGGLVADLVERVAARLAGQRCPTAAAPPSPTAEQERLADRGRPHRRPGPGPARRAEPPAEDADPSAAAGPEPVGVELLIAVPDQPGVLARRRRGPGPAPAHRPRRRPAPRSTPSARARSCC